LIRSLSTETLKISFKFPLSMAGKYQISSALTRPNLFFKSLVDFCTPSLI
jgi:hypothetical protein